MSEISFVLRRGGAMSLICLDAVSVVSKDGGGDVFDRQRGKMFRERVGGQ